MLDDFERMATREALVTRIDAGLFTRIDAGLFMLRAELLKAMQKHKGMNSPHEGWSVIFEELEELREHVRADTGDGVAARKEAMQVAAMGLRYALDLCGDAEARDAKRREESNAHL